MAETSPLTPKPSGSHAMNEDSTSINAASTETESTSTSRVGFATGSLPSDRTGMKLLDIGTPTTDSLPENPLDNLDQQMDIGDILKILDDDSVPSAPEKNLQVDLDLDELDGLRVVRRSSVTTIAPVRKPKRQYDVESIESVGHLSLRSSILSTREVSHDAVESAGCISHRSSIMPRKGVNYDKTGVDSNNSLPVCLLKKTKSRRRTGSPHPVKRNNAKAVTRKFGANSSVDNLVNPDLECQIFEMDHFKKVPLERRRVASWICCCIILMPVLLSLIVFGVTKNRTHRAASSYDTIENLNVTKEDNDFNPSSYPPVSESCNMEAFKQKHDGVEECREVCADAQCCRSKDAAENCSNDRPLFCNYFSKCEELIAWDTQHGSTATLMDYSVPTKKFSSDVEQKNKIENYFLHTTCSSTNLKSLAGNTTCKGHCEKGECCLVEGGKYCTVDIDTKYCKDYTMCNAFPEYARLAALPAKLEVDIACASDNIYRNGETECERLCVPLECCLGEDGNSCSSSFRTEYCEGYKACKILSEFH